MELEKIQMIKKFKLLPIIEENSYEHLCILKNKSMSLGFTKEKLISKINLFIDFIAKNEHFFDEHFSWQKSNKKKHEIPIVIKYLFWSGIEEIVFEEEIKQIISLQNFLKRTSYKGNSQWWHDYADLGYDVLTFEQYRKVKYKNEKKSTMFKNLNGAKGLVLMYKRPGIKFKTRLEDKNNPLRWGDKKKEFDHRCATCGDEEGKYSSSNGIIVRLEKGHIDSRKPYSHDNIIPQCGSCNNHSDKSLYGPSKDNNKKYIVIEKLS